METIKILNDYGVLNAIAIVTSPLISFIVLLCTLQHDRIQQKRLLDAQQKDHCENIKLMKEQHKNELQKQSEVNRIEIMPFFTLDKRDIMVKIENGKLYFEINLLNKGNGIAIELHGVSCEEDDKSSFIVMHRTYLNEYIYICPFDYESSVLRPNELCVFIMLREERNNTTICSCKMSNASTINDIVSFSIRYKDLLGHEYTQNFMYVYTGSFHKNSFEILRTSTGLPELMLQSLENLK